mmetsp:Transcript_17170/g.48264  ORF Transcript_17170/g.48264 Transcript_17170/m.48264 type:complete len:230 (-) Transcript_17170:47-736(-)
MCNSSIVNSSNHSASNDVDNEKPRSIASSVATSSWMSATRASSSSPKRQQRQHPMVTTVVDDDPRRRGEAINEPLHYPLTRRQEPAAGVVSDHQNSSHPHSSASRSSLPVIMEDQEYLERIRRFRPVVSSCWSRWQRSERMAWKGGSDRNCRWSFTLPPSSSSSLSRAASPASGLPELKRRKKALSRCDIVIVDNRSGGSSNVKNERRARAAGGDMPLRCPRRRASLLC